MSWTTFCHGRSKLNWRVEVFHSRKDNVKKVNLNLLVIIYNIKSIISSVAGWIQLQRNDPDVHQDWMWHIKTPRKSGLTTVTHSLEVRNQQELLQLHDVSPLFHSAVWSKHLDDDEQVGRLWHQNIFKSWRKEHPGRERSDEKCLA